MKHGKLLYSGAGRTREYGACALQVGYTRLDTHSQYATLLAFSLQQW